MKTFEGGVEPFVVSGESSEASSPCEASLNDPSSGQQHKASFGHGVLDHFEPQAVLLCGRGGVWSGVALIDVGQLNRMSGHMLHLFGQRRHLLSIPLNRPG
jgi:hypothetical protein